MIILVWVIRCKYYILKEALSGALLLHFIPTLGSNTKKIPLNTQDELCWYCYLKIYTPRKCSATVSFKKQNRISFLLYCTFPFSLANVNKLTCYKQIYIYSGGRHLCLRKEPHWCPQVEELKFTAIILDVTSLSSEKYIFSLLLGLS